MEIDINRLTELTEQLTPISDMALLLDVPEGELRDAISDETHPVSTAYRKAKAQLMLAIRKQDLELAEAGSPSAADAVRSHFLKMQMDE